MTKQGRRYRAGRRVTTVAGSGGPCVDPADNIRWLAQRCAASGLRMKDAQALFTTLYRSDALVLARGSVSAAADRAGVNRECFHRQRNHDNAQTEAPLQENDQ